MARCIIFCAGGFSRLHDATEKDDYLIAADGGLAYMEALGLKPHRVLGDFDSLGYTPEEASVFPTEKDDTDAMLAVRLGLSLGYREFLLYGTLDGPRLDHTLANLQTLAFLARQGAVGYLVGNTYMATLIREGSLVFPAEAEGIVSVFALGAEARGVEISGLKYELRGGTLTPDFPLGVSNQFVGKEAKISVEQGSLWVLWQRKTGAALPTRQEKG